MGAAGNRGGGKLSDPFSFRFSRGLEARIYPDCRPRNMEIADLQKEVVLCHGGDELVEEGTGFGVPVVIYSDAPRFSSTASCYLLDGGEVPIVIKAYEVDTIPAKESCGNRINNAVYKTFDRQFMRVYIGSRHVRPLLDKFILLSSHLSIRSRYIKVKSKGTVIVSYGFVDGGIEVEVDASGLDVSGCESLELLNEQGPSFFRRYCDSDGLVLIDGHVGPWCPVSAREASIYDFGSGFGFAMERKGGAKMFRGREKRSDVSWIDLEYLLEPKRTSFSYFMKLDAGVHNP